MLGVIVQHKKDKYKIFKRSDMYKSIELANIGQYNMGVEYFKSVRD